MASPIGNLKVITGPMYAGKTSSILQDILWINHCNKKILVIKPEIDNRYSESHIATHDQLSFPCVNMTSWDQILEKYNLRSYNYHTVFLDEVQFMPTDQTVRIVTNMIQSGVNVTATGLNQDSRGLPFETTAMLMSLSDEIRLLQSTCTTCGRPASKTQRLNDAGERIAVGSTGMYQPRCVEHWTPQ